MHEGEVFGGVPGVWWGCLWHEVGKISHGMEMVLQSAPIVDLILVTLVANWHLSWMDLLMMRRPVCLAMKVLMHLQFRGTLVMV